MPPIIPPNENLLNAPSATPPVARRLTISYQVGNEAPTKPLIDRGVDIQQTILDQLVEYTTDRTQVNNIPVSGLPVQKVGFANLANSQQPRYINTTNIPNAESEFNSQPTQFPIENVTPDPVGINYKTDDGHGPRNFYLNIYQKLYINQDNAKLHGDTLDATMLATRGHNSDNSTVTPAIAQSKNDGPITLGSYFYKTVGNNVNYVTGSYVRTTGETQTSVPAMTIDQMKVLGLNIMFEAVQGPAGFDFAIKEENGALKTEAEARMALPSPQKIGKRVELGRFTAAYQIGKIHNVSKPNNTSFIENTDDVQTYGSFYNVFAQFDSLISLSQIALAIAMILAFVLILDLLSLAFRLGRHPTDTEQGNLDTFAGLTTSEKQRLLGASVLDNSAVYPLNNVGGTDILTQFLGIEKFFSYTRHPKDDCLNAGIQEFFGFSLFGGSQSTGVTPGQQLANASLKVLTESGRLNVVLREILRSGISLVEDASSDFSGGASIAAIGNLLRKIRDLKIVRFINVLMGMGDKVMFESNISAAASINRNNTSTAENGAVSGSNVSYVDSLPDLRQNYIAKSRIGGIQNGLIWSNSKAGMQHLPLAGFINVGSGSSTQSHWAQMNLNVNGVPATGSLVQNDSANSARGRLPQSIVQEVERILDADYMPFYVQDLRTNEILSFHAFLEDASEDFQIEYSSQEGYGRMDKVQIYKGTTRNISVNFKMIATNPNDHDLMWYKINKLAMMIYPQWTQGRKIEVQHLKFIQPFSQIPGATPVIRLRLGDLYKSNYSKMAVARLFGITTHEGYNVNGQVPSSVAAAPPAADAGTGTPATNTYRDQADKLDKVKTGTHLAKTTSEATTGRGHHAATVGVEDVFKKDDQIILQGFDHLDQYKLGDGPIPTIRGNRYGRILATVDSVVAVGNDNACGINVVLNKYIPDAVGPDISNPASQPGINITKVNGGDPTPVLVRLSRLQQNSNILDFDNTSNLFRIKANQAPPATPATPATPTTPTATGATEEDINNLTPQTFYDPTKNPIMKAFNSSGGTGLAGVITSFKVDYGDSKANWGIEGDKLLRAPMFVTIQLQMAVIHDITPGLDANGIMNAPIWPVGNTSNFFMADDRRRDPEARPPSQTFNPSSARTLRGAAAGRAYFDVDGDVPLYYNRKD